MFSIDDRHVSGRILDVCFAVRHDNHACGTHREFISFEPYVEGCFVVFELHDWAVYDDGFLIFVNSDKVRWVGNVYQGTCNILYFENECVGSGQD